MSRSDSVLSSLATRAGIDRAVAYGVLSKVFNGLLSLATIVLIALRFSRETQGYYYTFSNLVALQVFAEMGLGIVITQFSSHYWASLKLDSRGGIEGDPGTLAQLVSLGRFSLKWYGTAGVAAGLCIGVAGFLFFTQSPTEGVAWREPWIALCVLAAVKMWLIPLWSLLEGCNQVASLYFYRMVSTIALGACTVTAILLGWGLWAAPAGFLGELAVGLFFLGGRHREFVKTFLAPRDGPSVPWRKEILPLQARIGVSWMAGYFVSSFIAPVLFHYQGAAAAGQWGMTWSMFSMVTSISLMWITTRGPQFGVWIARREFETLDREFYRLLRVSFSVALLGTAAVLGLIWMLHRLDQPLSSRMLTPLPAALLGASVILANIPFAQAVYLRAHKQEPFLVPSIVQSVLMAAATLVLGRSYGALGVAWGNLAVVGLVLVPWALVLWVRCRAAWHAPVAES